MSIICCEGARRSGKSFLINSQKVFPHFKFEFNEAFEGLVFEKSSTDVHYFGLGKELMLHQLDRDGLLVKQFPTGWNKNTNSIIVDRGIITNTVWAIFQNRISEQQAEKELRWVMRQDLLRNSCFVCIEGTAQLERKKDIWDSADARVQEEKDLFNHFFNLLEKTGHNVKRFKNNFDTNSVVEFDNFLKDIESELCAVF